MKKMLENAINIRERKISTALIKEKTKPHQPRKKQKIENTRQMLLTIIQIGKGRGKNIHNVNKTKHTISFAQKRGKNNENL